MLERCFGPRSYVENFARACSGKVTSLNVAYGVAASLATCETDHGNVAKQIGNAFELDVMKLDGLASREMTPATGVFDGQIAHAVELCSSDRSVGSLDSDHLVMAALALTINAIVQAEHAKDVVGEIAFEVASELNFKFGNVGSGVGIDCELRHLGSLGPGEGNLTRRVRNVP
ncbi:unannotated protein [freshwater metagenome]|uniref:Unannotated protein n=1 Tax=freshwater metagenome TaxID=449393 RepID=A0A6J6YUP8_9ZZZZ